jgi:hypothetical protein
MVEGEIYFVSKLAADFWAGDVGTAEDGEGNAGPVIESVSATRKGLELIFAEAVLVGNSSEELGS